MTNRDLEAMVTSDSQSAALIGPVLGCFLVMSVVMVGAYVGYRRYTHLNIVTAPPPPNRLTPHPENPQNKHTHELNMNLGQRLVQVIFPVEMNKHIYKKSYNNNNNNNNNK